MANNDSSAPIRVTRPPMERMLRIHAEIQKGGFPNATTLAALTESAPKTIQRDLAFMRDRLALPLAYDPVRHGYHYTEEVSGFPSIQLTEGELFAMLVAEKALQQYRGTSFERPLVSAFKKMAESLPETVSLNLNDWDQSIFFRTSAVPVMDLELFDKLAKATARKEQIEIVYRKPGTQAGERRVVDPLQLANINGEWFLFAFDHLREDLRTFVPARIQSATLTGRHFKRAKKFSLESRLSGSFGVISGEKPQTVVIRFSPYAAEFIREKQWHPSQEIRSRPDGGIDLSLTLTSLVEVQRWILSWGGHAVVKKPAELIDRIREDARRLLENH